jgi:hypothetical protein
MIKNIRKYNYIVNNDLCFIFMLMICNVCNLIAFKEDYSKSISLAILIFLTLFFTKSLFFLVKKRTILTMKGKINNFNKHLVSGVCLWFIFYIISNLNIYNSHYASSIIALICLSYSSVITLYLTCTANILFYQEEETLQYLLGKIDEAKNIFNLKKTFIFVDYIKANIADINAYIKKEDKIIIYLPKINARIEENKLFYKDKIFSISDIRLIEGSLGKSFTDFEEIDFNILEMYTI